MTTSAGANASTGYVEPWKLTGGGEPLGHDPADRRRGRRVDNASRAMAAYPARRCFDYSASQVAAVLGYRSHRGVSNAIVRTESASSAIQRTADQLARELH